MSRVDRWIQKMTVVAMVALAMTLLAVGVALYAQPAHAVVESAR